MALSKKHFERMAKAIAFELREPVSPQYRQGVLAVARAFAAMSIDENPRFDWVRFFTAIGEED